MTRYLCGHTSHRRGLEAGAVDVTAQVRLGREMAPRPQAYLAIIEDVVDMVMGLGEGPDRRERIEHLISGDPGARGLPVVLMSRRTVARQPGRYELDELRSEEPEIDRIIARIGSPAAPAVAAGDDLVVIEEAPASWPTAATLAAGSSAMLTRQQQRAPVIVPQGVYLVNELAANLAIADRTEAALVDAIRSTPLHDTRTFTPTDRWRVVITCPMAEGSPPASHEVMFAGTGEKEADVAYGIPVDAWDARVEATALTDMAPGAEVSRVERRVWALLGAEVLIAAALLVFGWLSGGLALAAREVPVWLGFALVLAGAAIALAALPLFAVREPSANMNDTFVLRSLYESRLSVLRVLAAVSATLFGFAMLLGVIPPLFVETQAIPAATVTFDTSTQTITATMRVRATGFGSDDVLAVTMREYVGASDEVGTLVGQVTRHGSPSGVVSWSDTFAVDANASYVSVLVAEGGASDAGCSPWVAGPPGCTVLAVPQLTPSTPRRTTIVAPTVIAPGTPSPAVPTVSATPSVPTPSVPTPSVPTPTLPPPTITASPATP